MKGNWHRYTYRQACAVCGHKGWCMYEGPIESPYAVLCARISEGAAKRKDGTLIEARDGQGWLHRLRQHPADEIRRMARHVEPPVKREPLPALDVLARQCASRITDEQVHDLSATLGLSEESLRRLRLGWFADEGCWTFPMWDGAMHIVGIRTRFPGGAKRSITGSFNGLFIPHGWRRCTILFIVEGPTDCAAMLDMGFDCIGRPSNTAGHDYLVEFCRRGPWRDVAIIKNNDAEGSRARELTDMFAERLSEAITETGRRTTVLRPPVKDVRDWKNNYECTSEMIVSLIAFPAPGILPSAKNLSRKKSA